MAVSADRVVVELEAKLDRYTARVTGAERHFDRSMRNIQGSAQRTEARVVSGFRNMASALGVTIGVAGTLAAARAFLGIADAAKNLEAQLRLATRESGSFAQAQDDVRRIARETRSDLGAVGTLYATIMRNARQLQITQEQAAAATQSVAQSFIVSGASASEAAAGTRQLLQALQSGVLRGDEFNSIMENAPRLARLFADSLGVTIGQLRAMSREGELTADKMMRALSDPEFTAELQAEFERLPVTFEQAMTLVSNAAQITFGAFDQGGEFSTMLADFFGRSAEGFSDMEDDARDTGAFIRAAFEGLSGSFDPLESEATSVFNYIKTLVDSLFNDIQMLTRAWDDITGNYPRFGIAPTIEIRRRINADSNYVPPPGFYDAAGAMGRRRDTEYQARTNNAGLGRSWQEQMDFYTREALGPPTRPPSGGTRRRGGGRGESAETRARREAAETQRFENELAELNQDLIAARQATVAAAEAVAAFEIQEIEVARDRQNAAYQASVEQTRGDRAVAQGRADQLVALNNQVAEERIRAVRLREERRLFDEREAALERLLELDRTDLEIMAEMERLSGQLAETREAQRDSALRELDLSTEMERIQLRSVIEAADRLAALEALGQATRAEVAAAQDAAAIARRQLDALGGQDAAQRQLINRQFESPRERYMRDLRAGAANVGDQLEQIQVGFMTDLADETARAAREMLGLSGALGNLAERLIRLALDRGILALLNALSGGGGGGKGLGDIAMLGAKLFTAGAGFGGGKAAGGPVSGGRPYLVGEKGPELFVPGISGTIVPQGRDIASIGGASLSRAAQTQPVVKLIVEPSPYFDGRVLQVAGPAIEIAGTRAAASGAAMAGRGLSKSMRHTLR